MIPWSSQPRTLMRCSSSQGHWKSFQGFSSSSLFSSSFFSSPSSPPFSPHPSSRPPAGSAWLRRVAEAAALTSGRKGEIIRQRRRHFAAGCGKVSGNARLGHRPALTQTTAQTLAIIPRTMILISGTPQNEGMVCNLAGQHLLADSSQCAPTTPANFAGPCVARKAGRNAAIGTSAEADSWENGEETADATKWRAWSQFCGTGKLFASRREPRAREKTKRWNRRYRPRATAGSANQPQRRQIRRQICLRWFFMRSSASGCGAFPASVAPS